MDSMTKQYTYEEMSQADREFSDWLREINPQPSNPTPQPSACSRRDCYLQHMRQHPTIEQLLIRSERARNRKEIRKHASLFAEFEHFYQAAQDYGVGCIRPRHVWRVVQEHAPKKTIAALAAFALLAGLESLPGVMPFVHAEVARQPHQFHDSEHGSKPRTKIINNSNGSITITFTGCRENEKHHVSCQFTDSEGNAHWVYLAGTPLPPGN